MCASRVRACVERVCRAAGVVLGMSRDAVRRVCARDVCRAAPFACTGCIIDGIGCRRPVVVVRLRAYCTVYTLDEKSSTSLIRQHQRSIFCFVTHRICAHEARWPHRRRASRVAAARPHGRGSPARTRVKSDPPRLYLAGGWTHGRAPRPDVTRRRDAPRPR